MITQNTLENLTGCVLANFVALSYNEKIKHTQHYKHNLKRLINPLIKELVKIEEKEFDLICSTNESDMLDLSNNYIEFLEMLTKGSFKEFMSMQNLVVANSIDSKRLHNIANKIIKDSNN